MLLKIIVYRNTSTGDLLGEHHGRLQYGRTCVKELFVPRKKSLQAGTERDGLEPRI